MYMYTLIFMDNLIVHHPLNDHAHIIKQINKTCYEQNMRPRNMLHPFGSQRRLYTAFNHNFDLNVKGSSK